MAGNGPRGEELGVGYISLTVDSSSAAQQIQNDVASAGAAGGQAGGQQAADGFKKELGDKLKTGLKAAGVGIGAAAAGGIVSGLSQAMDEQGLIGSIQARLGVGAEEAGHIADAAGDAYKSGWGESLDEVGSTAADLQQILTELGDGGSLKDMTVNATALAATFDQDLNKVINSAGNLVRTGLVDNMDEAFDIMAAGFQSNGKLSEDFLDSIDEYGVQFQSAGIDAADALGMMNQSLAAGARNGDLVADALKEWSLLGMDLGNKNVVSAYEALGFSAEEMANKVAAGGPAAKEALQQVLDALRTTEDPLAQATAATGLFGTKYEDLKYSLLALDPSTAANGFTDLGGTASELTENAKGMDQVVAELGRTLNDGLGAALTPLLPQLQELAGKGLDFFRFLAEHPDFTQLLLALGTAIGVITAAQWLWNAAAAANPVTWVLLIIVAAIAVVVAVFLALGATWDDIINGIVAAFDWWWGWIDKISGMLNGLPGIFSNVGVWFDLVFGSWEYKLEAIQKIINKVIDLLNGAGGMINDVFGTEIGHIGTFKMPGLATGGTVTHKGSVLVGEQGPEILRLPQGASVIPLDHPAANVATGAAGAQWNLNVYNPQAEPTSTSLMKATNLLGASFV